VVDIPTNRNIKNLANLLVSESVLPFDISPRFQAATKFWAYEPMYEIALILAMEAYRGPYLNAEE
jgi:hypothetical protein